MPVAFCLLTVLACSKCCTSVWLIAEICDSEVSYNDYVEFCCLTHSHMLRRVTLLLYIAV